MKVQEYKIEVRQFLTRPSDNPQYKDKKPVPMRTMFGYILQETPKGVKVRMKGKPMPASVCLHCGITLTHPVSLLYGIGQVCGQHFHINPLSSEEELKQQYESIRQKLADVTWEG